MFIWLIIAVILAALVLWLVVTYNRFIRWKNLMREAWSGIDVQLKRRYDLVPNLVETVRGYSEYERRILNEVTESRSECLKTGDIRGKMVAENHLSQALKTLFAVVENYPDLKADQQYLDLQQNLVEIEDQIQLARRYYNGTVRNFNILVESFPSLLIATLVGFKLADYFEIETATERQAPQVQTTTSQTTKDTKK